MARQERDEDRRPVPRLDGCGDPCIIDPNRGRVWLPSEDDD
jgi:hypothetical protein